MCRTLSIFIVSAAVAAGCASAPAVQTPGMAARTFSLRAEPAPALRTLRVQFCETTNFPASDDWTNQWTFVGAAVSTDLERPLPDWQIVPEPMEDIGGHLGFTVQSDAPQLYLRSVFQPKP